MKNLRNLREDNNLTQTQVAEKLNIGQTTYSRYESGELSIPYESLIVLAFFYNTSIDYLVGITRVKKPYERME